MAEAATDNTTEVRGAEKKEAFHREAEAKIEKFKFARPDQHIPDGDKMHVKLTGTNSCRASVQILVKGGDNNLHYHPNMDLIYMVLKGKVEFYGPNDALLGVFGEYEGLLLPENSRYWFKGVSDEAHLLQIAGYPKGKAASKRIPVEKAKRGKGVWLGLTEEELRLRDLNNQHGDAPVPGSEPKIN
jgi:quercetin dioxygenase-like cupin family protein